MAAELGGDEAPLPRLVERPAVVADEPATGARARGPAARPPRQVGERPGRRHEPPPPSGPAADAPE